MHRRDVAGIVDRDRATDGVGDLQPSVQARVEQQDALAIGEFDRRNVGLAGDLGNLVEIRAEFLPAPEIGSGLHLAGGDAAGRELSAALAAGLAEPGSLGRRVRLRAHPDIMLAGFGVDRLHQFARLAGERRMGGFGRGFGCGGGHDVLSCDVEAIVRRFPRMAAGWAAPDPETAVALAYSPWRKLCNWRNGMPGLRRSHLAARNCSMARVKPSGWSMLEICPAPGNST